MSRTDRPHPTQTHSRKPLTSLRLFIVASLAVILGAYLRPQLPSINSLSTLLPRRPFFTSPIHSTCTTDAMSNNGADKPATPDAGQVDDAAAAAIKAMDRYEFRKWNRLADSMNAYHSRFEWEFNHVYEMADGGWKKSGRSFTAFLREAQDVSNHLDMHHRIEESWVFPMLAKKLPQFSANWKGSDDHVKMHKAIHDGLEKYNAYLDKARRNPNEYDGAELRKIMDSFRTVLFHHLEQEVKDLGAESLYRAGFTLDELAQSPLWN